jgi:hypothetical protein
MGSPLVIMGDPRFQDSSHMPLVEWDKEIETFSPHGADEPFTKSICLRRSERCPQDPYAERFQVRIEVRRVDAVPVVKDEPIRLFTGDDVSKLLKCPGCRRMSGYVEVSNLTGPCLHDHKDIDDSEASRHDDEEIGCQHRLGVISDQCHPLLRGDALSRHGVEGHAAPHRPGGHLNSQFEQQLRRDALFPPPGSGSPAPS